MTRQRHRLGTPVSGEDGYAMVVTVSVITILTLLLVVVLAQALHNNTATTVGARRSRALGVAEAGVSWAIAALDTNPAAAVVTNRAVPVADGSGGTGTATVTVRKGTPTNPSRLGYYTIFATGQVAQTSTPTRTLRVVIGPAASFTYAFYADSSLTLEQNACIVGGVYAQGDVFFKNNTTIAGTSKARGSLISGHGVIREFDGASNPKCPATVEGEAVDASNDIHGDVLAGGGSLSPCKIAPAGAVSASAQGFNLNGSTVGGRACNDPPPYTMPAYTFDPTCTTTRSTTVSPPGTGRPRHRGDHRQRRARGRQRPGRPEPHLRGLAGPDPLPGRRDDPAGAQAGRQHAADRQRARLRPHPAPAGVVAGAGSLPGRPDAPERVDHLLTAARAPAAGG